MICANCLTESPILATCAGSNCRAGVCPDCYDGDGLCDECRDEVTRAFVSDPLVALLLGGARIGHERMPLCSASGEPADECGHMEADDVA